MSVQDFVESHMIKDILSNEEIIELSKLLANYQLSSGPDNADVNKLFEWLEIHNELIKPLTEYINMIKTPKRNHISPFAWLYQKNDPQLTRRLITYILNMAENMKMPFLPQVPSECISNLNNPKFTQNNKLFIDYGVFIAKKYGYYSYDMDEVLNYITKNNDLQFLPYLIDMLDVRTIDMLILRLSYYSKKYPAKFVATVLLILQRKIDFSASMCKRILPLIYNIAIFALVNYCTMYQYLQWYYYYTPLNAYKHTKKMGIVPIQGPSFGPKLYKKYDKFLPWDLKNKRDVALLHFKKRSHDLYFGERPQDETTERNILNEITQPFIASMINYLVKLLKNDIKYAGYTYLALTRSKNFDNNDTMIRVANNLKKYVLANKK